MTICTKCLHFHNLEPGSPRADVWYNHLCMVAPLPKRMDPYDGKCKHYATNDLGKEYFTDRPFKYCSELNDTNCKLFDPSSRLAAAGSRGAS